jgi:hypothetical protein
VVLYLSGNNAWIKCEDGTSHCSLVIERATGLESLMEKVAPVDNDKRSSSIVYTFWDIARWGKKIER